jgi:hypothetical protein
MLCSVQSVTLPTFRDNLSIPYPGVKKPRRIALTVKMTLGPIRLPETSVSNYQSTLRKMSKQRRSQGISVRRDRKLNRCIGYIRLRTETCVKHKTEKLLVFVLFYGFVQVFTTWTLDSDVLSVSKPSGIHNYLTYYVGDWHLGDRTKYFLFFTTSFSCSHLCPEDGNNLFFRNVDATY